MNKLKIYGGLKNLLYVEGCIKETFVCINGGLLQFNDGTEIKALPHVNGKFWDFEIIKQGKHVGPFLWKSPIPVNADVYSKDSIGYSDCLSLEGRFTSVKLVPN